MFGVSYSPRGARIERAGESGSGRSSPVLEAEIVILEFNVEEGSDELVTDLGPADIGEVQGQLMIQQRESTRLPDGGQWGSCSTAKRERYSKTHMTRVISSPSSYEADWGQLVSSASGAAEATTGELTSTRGFSTLIRCSAGMGMAVGICDTGNVM